MTNPDSKQQKVMKCLKKWGQTLTPRECVYYFDHWRLSDIVYRMRAQGFNIVNIGEPGKHAIYKRKRA